MMEGTYSYEDAIPFANQKCSLVGEIRFFDGIDIIVPGATPQVRSDLLNDIHDSLLIGRTVTTQSEHET
jgi:hypothetical protein